MSVIRELDCQQSHFTVRYQRRCKTSTVFSLCSQYLLRTSVLLIVSGVQLFVKFGSPRLIKYQFLPYTQAGLLTLTKYILLLIRTVPREILPLHQLQNSNAKTSSATQYKYALHIYLPKHCLLIQEDSLLAVRDIYPPTNFLSYVFTLFIRLLLKAEEFLFRVSNCEPLIETNPIAISVSISFPSTSFSPLPNDCSPQSTSSVSQGFQIKSDPFEFTQFVLKLRPNLFETEGNQPHFAAISADTTKCKLIIHIDIFLYLNNCKFLKFGINIRV